MNEAYSEVLDYLPEKFLVALGTGGTAYWETELAGENWFATPCDCERQWHKIDYWDAYRAEDGKLIHEIHSTDEDGNPDYECEAEVGTPEEARLLEEYFGQAHTDSWIEYSKWVRKTGLDPLDEFSVKTHGKHSYRVKFRRGIAGIYFIGARKLERGRYLPPEQLPQELLDFLFISVDNKFDETKIKDILKEGQTPWDFLTNVSEITDKKVDRCEFTGVVHGIKVPYQESYVINLRKHAAKKHLREEREWRKKQKRRQNEHA